MKSIVVLFGLLALIPFAYAAPETGAGEKAALGSLLSTWVDRDAKSPGIVVALVDRRGPRFYAHGRTHKAGVPVNADTHFEIGSLTKVFTALLMCRMEHAGLVDSGAPVQTYLPEGIILPKPHEKPVTLLHLATHSSGLPRMPFNFIPADHRNPYAAYSARNLYDFLVVFKPSAAPGSAYAYSNAGYGLLGLVLERAGGNNFQALLDQYVLGPLGLKNTRMNLTQKEKGAMARPHDDKGNAVPVWDFKSLYAAGALKSNARDLARFLACQLGNRSHGMTETFERMMRPVLPLAQDRDGDFMAIGWHLLRFDGGIECVAHDGGTGGTRSLLLLDPGKRWGVAVLANATHNCTPVALDIIQAVWKEKG